MKSWNMRSHEVAFLLNPAFCGRVLYSTIKTYNEKTSRAFPFPLIYLVLPLVLHKETRIHINSRTQLLHTLHCSVFLLTQIDQFQDSYSLINRRKFIFRLS